MKRLLYTALLTLGLSSAALAASGQDNAPPAAPQRLASAHGAATPSAGHDSAPLDKHQRAIIAHRAMNNSSAAAHQQIIQGHQRMHDAETQGRGK
ncbi:Silver binding protein silver resistance [Edwardsiella anguillarum]|uniref:hypothetical protein n=1 Tax=Edwardsiella TaxID=635 RepID=UPI00045D0F16|nr:hypothetical protein [Edwardsiella anguillarum]AKM47929.1 silver resistance protein [Edwardsiella sp. EA181011]GAJ68810.1 silver binding protein; silver resistance [Edwardsiella piscicida]RFT03722.1 silver resistance protein [Edwardsiella anguillarum]BET80860.1 Silver binding protein silver resistance [Edwardsiella anguillarum]BET84149.1 Silver binding protein silver resistance [Edwardsiella anguillarum]